MVGIDTSMYPYYVENETLMFKRDAGGDAPLFAALEFNGSDNKVTEGAGDTFPKVRVFQVSEGVVRLEGDFTVLPKAGNILVLRHGKRIHPGGLVQNSESVRLENVNMYQTGGLGILFQFCKDITVSEIAFEANRKKGRRILTGHDDGLHFSNVGGSVQVENCRFHGLMDDPINVHGTAVCVLEKVSDRTLRCAYRHPQSLGFTEWAVPGNQISFLRPGNRQEYAQLHAVEYKLITAEEFEITFDELLPDFVQPGHALENLTNTPEFICRKNYFGSTRARGLLVTTPKKVLIEENIFESSGSAILLAGDINEWYESGTCTDVTIRRNRFMSCYTSEYQFCNGVIDIEPSVEESQSACVHRNIRIMDNLFVLASPAILYADHTEDIVVEGNSIFMDEGLGEPEFILYDCKKVSVFDNTVNGVKNKMAEFKI